MPNVFLTSDHHFMHANILKFVGDDGARFRPFDSLDEMNERLVEKWNEVVRNDDVVYHLGDFSWSPAHTGEFYRRLRGRKDELLLGNHDDASDVIRYFKRVRLWRVFRNEGFVASHVPLAPAMFRSKADVQVHGHTHQRDAEGPYVNISVERWGFRPASMDEVLERVRQLRS